MAQARKGKPVSEAEVAAVEAEMNGQPPENVMPYFALPATTLRRLMRHLEEGEDLLNDIRSQAIPAQQQD